MRVLLGLLILLNVAMLYLVMQEPAEKDPLAGRVATNLPPLVLLSEARPPDSPRPQPELPAQPGQQESPPARAVSTPRKVPGATPDETAAEILNPEVGADKAPAHAVFLELACYTLGPFSAEKGADTASQTLNELGLVTSKQFATRKELSGYWVYIPPLPSRSDARKVTRMLKGRGIKDFLIVGTGEKKNAISLGFFRTREAAEQHRARMQALGLTPQLEASYRENKGFWLDFASPNQPPLPGAIIDALQSQYDGISMQKRPCS